MQGFLLLTIDRAGVVKDVKCFPVERDAVNAAKEMTTGEKAVAAKTQGLRVLVIDMGRLFEAK